MSETKRLYRSETDVMLGGVCAGLGDFFNLDPTIMRLIFVVLFLTGSLGFWVYVVMWIVVPLESDVKGSTAHVVESRTVDEQPEPLDLNDSDVE